VCPEWEAVFPNLSQKSLPRFSLGHFPILFHCGAFKVVEDILVRKYVVEGQRLLRTS
jgi:hypothetical protein